MIFYRTFITHTVENEHLISPIGVHVRVKSTFTVRIENVCSRT